MVGHRHQQPQNKHTVLLRSAINSIYFYIKRKWVYYGIENKSKLTL